MFVSAVQAGRSLGTVYCLFGWTWRMQCNNCTLAIDNNNNQSTTIKLRRTNTHSTFIFALVIFLFLPQICVLCKGNDVTNKPSGIFIFIWIHRDTHKIYNTFRLLCYAVCLMRYSLVSLDSAHRHRGNGNQDE